MDKLPKRNNMVDHKTLCNQSRLHVSLCHFHPSSVVADIFNTITHCNVACCTIITVGSPMVKNRRNRACHSTVSRKKSCGIAYSYKNNTKLLYLESECFVIMPRIVYIRLVCCITNTAQNSLLFICDVYHKLDPRRLIHNSKKRTQILASLLF